MVCVVQGSSCPALLRSRGQDSVLVATAGVPGLIDSEAFLPLSGFSLLGIFSQTCTHPR